MGKCVKEKTPEEIDYQKSFGNQLKELLKTIGVTQLEFSQTLKIHKNTVCQWVTGKSFPEPLLFKKIITFFLENPKSNDFDIYNLLMIKNSQTQHSEFESIIKTLKKNCENSLIENERESSSIKKLEKENTQLKQKIRELKIDLQSQTQLINKYERSIASKVDYERLKKELEQEKTTYKEKVWENELYNLYIKLLEKVSWYPKNLITNILNKKEFSDLMNKYSTTQNEYYNDIVDDIKKYLMKHIPYEMYLYLKELSQEIKQNV